MICRATNSIFLTAVACLLLAACKKPQVAISETPPPPPPLTNVAKPATSLLPVAEQLPRTNPPAAKAEPGQELFLKGFALLEGKDGDADPAAAAKLFQEAADLGNGSAEHALRVLYLDGQGVEKEPQKALVFLQKAADKGHVEAVFKLASL